MCCVPWLYWPVSVECVQEALGRRLVHERWGVIRCPLGLCLVLFLCSQFTTAPKTKSRAVKPKTPWDQWELPSSPTPKPVSCHSVLSSSVAPSGTWVSRSLRTRQPQPCCRPGDPQASSCCPAPQTVLPHPGAASCGFSTAQHPPNDRRGVSMVNSLRPASLCPVAEQTRDPTNPTTGATNWGKSS